MAPRNPPMWLENRTDHHGEEYRNLLDALIAEREGIAGPGDMKVTQLPTPARQVRVALGACFVKGDDLPDPGSDQGAYFVWNDGHLDLAIAPADGTNPRKDIVVCRVKDAEYTGAINAASIEVITGAPAATPLEPALPNTAHKLAIVAVAAGATSITDANITDTRLRTAALGGIIPVLSTAKPSHQEPLAIWLTDKDRLEISDGTGWVPQEFGGFTRLYNVGYADRSNTVMTEYFTQNIVLAANIVNVPFTMLVEIMGKYGFSGSDNSLDFEIHDETGADITAPLSDAGGGLRQHAGVSHPFSLRGKKQYAANAAAGFRCAMKVNAANSYATLSAKVSFVPGAI